MIQAAMETVMEKGKADPTSSGAIASKKRMAPIQAHFTHQPLAAMPAAISPWPQAISGMMI